MLSTTSTKTQNTIQIQRLITSKFTESQINLVDFNCKKFLREFSQTGKNDNFLVKN